MIPAYFTHKVIILAELLNLLFYAFLTIVGKCGKSALN